MEPKKENNDLLEEWYWAPLKKQRRLTFNKVKERNKAQYDMSKMPKKIKESAESIQRQ